ncbi:MAG: replication initiator protein A [Janthinobacterium lividum]
MAKRPLTSVQTAIALPDAIDLVRFEKNLLQIGFFSAHDPRTKGDPDITRRIEQWVNRDGKKIRVSAEFRSTLGLPSTADRDKYMAFMKIAMDRKLAQGQLTNPIRFSGYSMLKALGVSDSGANYDDLNQWGMRMADTTITSEQIIYSSSRKKYMNKTVHVFRSFTRVGESDFNGNNNTVHFAVELEDWLLENLNQSYVVPEDFTQYRKLLRPTAKGIFVYLYVWFYASRGKDVEKDYAELCALLNVRCYQHVSKIRETMGLSLDDLVRIGYLKTWDVKPMVSKKGFKLIMAPGREILQVIANTQRKQMSATSAAKELTSAQQAVQHSLQERGVDEERALALCSAFDPELIREKVEYLDQEIARDKGKRIQNPAGFIIAWIESGKAVPHTFESSRQREERHKLLAEQRQQTEENAALQHAEWALRDRFKAWRMERADEAIASLYPAAKVDERLKVIRTQIAKDATTARYLDRLMPQERREALLKLLRKEVASELDLLTFEEWSVANGQGTLFS